MSNLKWKNITFSCFLKNPLSVHHNPDLHVYMVTDLLLDRVTKVQLEKLIQLTQIMALYLKSFLFVNLSFNCAGPS